MCASISRIAGRVMVAVAITFVVGSAAADSDNLNSTAWVLASLPGRRLLPKSTPTARFEDGQVFGTDGCNRFGMAYTATNGTLKVNALGRATQMACPPEIMQQAEAFRSALTRATAYRVHDGRLELLGSDGVTLAELTAQSKSLAGTPWEVTGFNNGRQAVVSVLANFKLTMEFSKDGKVSGSAGCNTYTASYTFDGPRLVIDQVAVTRKMCPNVELMEQEQQFLKALATVATASFEGNQLEMRTADGALAVTLTK